jgi:hypothetical protein
MVPTRTREANTQTEVEAAESDAKAIDEGRLGPGPAFGAPSRLRRSVGKVSRFAKRKKKMPDEASSSLKSYLNDLRGMRGRSGSVFSQPHLGEGTNHSADMTSFLGPANRQALLESMRAPEDGGGRRPNLGEDDFVPLVELSGSRIHKKRREDLEEVGV